MSTCIMHGLIIEEVFFWGHLNMIAHLTLAIKNQLLIFVVVVTVIGCLEQSRSVIDI